MAERKPWAALTAQGKPYTKIIHLENNIEFKNWQDYFTAAVVLAMLFLVRPPHYEPAP